MMVTPALQSSAVARLSVGLCLSIGIANAGPPIETSGSGSAEDRPFHPTADCNRNGIDDLLELESGLLFERTVSQEVDGVRSVAFADIDGDGDNDLLSASAEDDTIAWFENVSGRGHFGSLQVIDISVDGAQSVIAADFDGDGDADVLAAARLADTVSWYENLDGAGTFSPPRLVSASVDVPWCVHAADIDGDGDLDALSASGGDDKVAWYENLDGLGTFGPQRVISTQDDAPRWVIAVDLDMDGNTDVAAVAYNESNITWFPNTDGLGTFGTRRVITGDVVRPRSIVAGDVDGDGDPDIVAASSGFSKITWYKNGGSGFMSQQTIDYPSGARSVDVADMDRDGDLDILAASSIAGTVAWYENHIDHPGSDGKLFGPAQAISAESDGAVSVVAADLDGDGYSDVAAASAGNDSIAAYMSFGGDCNANGRLDECDLAEGFSHDCDNDGVPDECQLDVVRFTRGTIVATASQVSTVATADLEGDGDLDVLAFSRGANTFTWYRNDGRGILGPQQTTTLDVIEASSVFAADVDGDGDADVLGHSTLDDRIAWWENLNGANSFGPGRILPFWLASSLIHTADLNGDGVREILSELGEGIVQLSYAGAGLFSFPQQIGPTSSPDQLLAADVDVDGDLDLFSVTGSPTRKYVWHENTNGAGNFGPEQIIASGDGPMLAADLDSDGDTDLVSLDNGDLIWFENDDGFYGPGSEHTITRQGVEVVAADFDGDGDIDLLSRDGDTWYPNHGDGVFAPLRSTGNPIAAVDWVETADLDGDGRPDLLVVHDGGKIAWLSNVGGDCNGNGIGDTCEIDRGYSMDCDLNGVPDECDIDCNGNEIPDACETADGGSPDCNGNGVPDECEADCNGNGQPDDCDIAAAASADCNQNGIPDECEVDCNGNGVPDDCDLTSGNHADCNANLIPDACEAAAGDCDGNGVLDECELLSFSTRQLVVGEADSVGCIAAEDIDGDGDLDLVVCMSGLDRIVWLRNDGLGSFGPAVDVTTAADNPRSIMAADVDGDGDLDLLSASSYDNTIAWYENVDGDGSFGPQIVITTEAIGARALWPGDIDGDGDLDVVTITFGDDEVNWHENLDGQGSFGPERLIGLDVLHAQSVTLSDLDGDGDADVLATGFADDSVVWYENMDGLGGFGPERVINALADQAETVRAADLDNDADNDVVAVWRGHVTWQENLDGAGDFGPPRIVALLTVTDGLEVSDLDGDGDLDILVGGMNGAWAENDGAGNFGPLRTIADADLRTLSALLAVDLNGDGNPDVVAADSWKDEVIWYANQIEDCNANRIPDACEPDQDGDGIIDDCESPACPGDVDSDLDVDLSDLAFVLTNFGSTGAGLDGDADADGDVDLTDLSIILANFGLTC